MSRKRNGRRNGPGLESPKPGSSQMQSFYRPPPKRLQQIINMLAFSRLRRLPPSVPCSRWTEGFSSSSESTACCAACTPANLEKDVSSRVCRLDGKHTDKRLIDETPARLYELQRQCLHKTVVTKGRDLAQCSQHTSRQKKPNTTQLSAAAAVAAAGQQEFVTQGPSGPGTERKREDMGGRSVR